MGTYAHYFLKIINMLVTTFTSSICDIQVDNREDFIQSFQESLNNNSLVKGHKIIDLGDGWVETANEQDDVLLWQPE